MSFELQQALSALCTGDADADQQKLVYAEFVKTQGRLSAREYQIKQLREVVPVHVRVAKDSLERVAVYPAIEIDAITHNACNRGA